MATVGSVLNVVYGIGGYFSSFLAVMCIMGIAFTPKESDFNRKMLLGCFGLLEGFSIGPLIKTVVGIPGGENIIALAVASTISVFLCFSLAALFAERRSWLYLGGFLVNALFLLAWISLLNLFFGSSFLMNAQIYGGLLLFSLYVIFDTQLIIEKSEAGDNDYILHSIDLFLDFIAIFIRILIIFFKNKKNDD